MAPLLTKLSQISHVSIAVGKYRVKKTLFSSQALEQISS
jgi:hypothetical protein